MEIGFKKIVCNLLGITARSYSNWAKELRPIITFFEKGYLNKNELKEFLDTGKIKKLDLIKNYTFEELQEKLNNQQNTIINLNAALNLLKEDNQKISLQIEEINMNLSSIKLKGN
ncbi:hypothetical protein N5U00_07945 [Aliarcobacter butzleri]|uniref:hypothetical protein n=1 Tax=Aliarcobacter butzleri TaxID=28197 RepID=UPI0006582CDC|nr:hypothetical protein [Aliarcobacter butzleri]KLE04229.1 hypothetical protein AF78_09080 [Aliarcobacter butzleri L353]MCT7575258.1 hypothetical protein [Aliarcobacter butzleri]MDN5086887.1 hypothetical protein [Aliarcobacter butzleri]